MSQPDLPADTLELARFLLGKRIVRILSDSVPDEPPAILRIVETEAYPPGDEAAHAYKRMTMRNRSLFREPGIAYVYLAYGICWMLNISSERAGVGAGVLVRAGVPEQGIAAMAARRPGAVLRDLARGPGRLARALAIDRRLDGVDLCRPGDIFLADGDGAAVDIGVSTRIGLTRAVERPWRFFEKGSAFLSGPAWLNAGLAAPASRVRRADPL